MEKIALLPGGFKPPHAGHYNMAKWLAANTDADSIVIRVGSKERGGITREMSLKLWGLYRESDPDSPPLSILASENNSPIADVYDFIEQEAPEGSKIYLGAGEKDKEDSRYNNINKFADPKNIDFEIVLVPPQSGGVSGTEMRGFINDGDKENFQKYLPEHLTPEQKDEAWKIVTIKPKPEIEEDVYDPRNKTLDFMRSSEYKAGLPDGHKEDIPRAYKYKRGGLYTGPGMGGGMYENKLNEQIYIPEDAGCMTFCDPTNLNLEELNPQIANFFDGEQLLIVPVCLPDYKPEDSGLISSYQFIVDYNNDILQWNQEYSSMVTQQPQLFGLDPVIDLGGSMGFPNEGTPGSIAINFATANPADWSETEILTYLVFIVNGSGNATFTFNQGVGNYPNMSSYWVSGVTDCFEDNSFSVSFDEEETETVECADMEAYEWDISIPPFYFSNSEEFCSRCEYEYEMTQTVAGNWGMPSCDCCDYEPEIEEPEPEGMALPDKEPEKKPLDTKTLEKEPLKEQQGGKTLRVYDFDDTLAVTEGANIKVKHEDGSIDVLNPAEFAVYSEQPGDKFDFTEFDREIKKAEPIQNIVSMLEKDLNTTAKVTILTARLMAYPVRRYLRTAHDLDAYVVAVGSADPQDKANWIKNHIEKGYNDILFIDDSEKNRNAVASLKDEYPDIKLEVQDPDSLSEMIGTMNKQEKRKHKRKLKKIRKGLKKYNKKNRYFKVPKSWRKKTLTRKMRKEQHIPQSQLDDDPYNHEEMGHYTTSTALINDLTIPLEIMRTPEEQTTGMMDREELNGGMMFPYDKVSKKEFHMEGCLIPLDIVFINKGIIGDIHSDCPPCKEPPCPKYSGLADNVLELPGGYCKENNINVGDEFNLNLTEENILTKEWWKKIITEHLLTEGGAAGHMAHPFNLPNVNSGKDLKDIFEKAADSLQTNPGSVKIDGVNSSIRLIDLDGEKQFVMDRGSKKPLDIQGITKADLEDRFKPGHGMIKIGGEVLDMFNKALPSLQSDLKKLGAWDDPNILFNMEYVSGKTNVQEYSSNFIAIHGLNKIESKEVQGKRKTLTQRTSSEIDYDKSALQSLLNNLAPIAKKNNFEVYGSVPTEMNKKPNFSSALSTTYTIVSNDEEKTLTLDAWLNELNDIPEEDFIFMNVDNSKKKVGAVSKQVYTNLLSGGNIDELFDDEEDKQKAIEGFTTYLATEKLGDEVLKVLDSPMGSVENHEGVVIRDKKISDKPFKITGKFILGGMTSEF